MKSLNMSIAINFENYELNFENEFENTSPMDWKNLHWLSDRLASLGIMGDQLTHFCPPLRSTFAVRETHSSA